MHNEYSLVGLDKILSVGAYQTNSGLIIFDDYCVLMGPSVQFLWDYFSVYGPVLIISGHFLSRKHETFVVYKSCAVFQCCYEPKTTILCERGEKTVDDMIMIGMGDMKILHSTVVLFLHPHMGIS